MKFLVIVNESPWGSGLALCAWRFVQAAIEKDMEVPAVFFHAQGVYNAVAAETGDAETPDLLRSWRTIAADHGTRLLLCSSSRKRRLPVPPGGGFSESGLAEMLDLVLTCDRVVSF